jgi:exodeoxyribonuclease V alpha subunit
MNLLAWARITTQQVQRARIRGGAASKSDDNNPLDCGLLVVDETSLFDVLLMQALMKAVAGWAALLIVGDIDQLPSVGPGQVAWRM